MTHRADLSFSCPSPQAATQLRLVLQAEEDDGPQGSTLRLEVQGEVLRAWVEAVDVATLRAAINSVTRLADAALRTLAA